MSKLKNVRDRQWNRYFNYLCAVRTEGGALSPPGAERWYQRRVNKFNRRQVKKE